MVNKFVDNYAFYIVVTRTFFLNIYFLPTETWFPDWLHTKFFHEFRYNSDITQNLTRFLARKFVENSQLVYNQNTVPSSALSFILIPIRVRSKRFSQEKGGDDESIVRPFARTLSKMLRLSPLGRRARQRMGRKKVGPARFQPTRIERIFFCRSTWTWSEGTERTGRSSSRWRPRRSLDRSIGGYCCGCGQAPPTNWYRPRTSARIRHPRKWSRWSEFFFFF